MKEYGLGYPIKCEELVKHNLRINIGLLLVHLAATLLQVDLHVVLV